MNIDSFKTALSKGGVRPHLFRVQGNIGNTSLPTKVGFLCKAAQLPATTIGSIEVPFRGRKIKLPGEREFAEWTLTFLSDGDFELRNAFEKWMDDLNQTVSNVSTSEHNLSGPLFPDWIELARQSSPTSSSTAGPQRFHQLTYPQMLLI